MEQLFIINRFLYPVIQWTWGILQNFAGLMVFCYLHRKPKQRYKGSIVTVWDKPTSLSLGMFIFIAPDAGEWLIKHEYGHSIQSIILGPSYLLVIGLPSVIWCNLPACINYRKQNHYSYYSFYTEKWANHIAKIE